MAVAKRNAGIALLALLACAAAEAATFAVDTTDDAVDAAIGDGLCARAGGGCTLRAAIQEANFDAAPDAIVLPAGTFALTLAGTNEDLSASGDLYVRASLAIAGAGPLATTIDGASLDRVLDLFAPSGTTMVSLTGMALANGRSTAVLSTSAGLGLRVATSVEVSATDVDVRDNVATLAFGGGIGIDNRGCFTGTRVRVLRNVDPASPGSARALAGGVTTRGATSCFTLLDSELSDNVGDQAGAIYADSGAPIVLRRSLVSGNVARFSGAFELNGQNDVLLENTTVSGNRGNPGAALVDGGATLRLRNCTVTLNHAAQSTATIGAIQDVHGGFGRTFITNTILAGTGPGLPVERLQQPALRGRRQHHRQCRRLQREPVAERPHERRRGARTARGERWRDAHAPARRDRDRCGRRRGMPGRRPARYAASARRRRRWVRALRHRRGGSGRARVFADGFE